MNEEFSRNLRLALAVTLVSVWGVAWLAEIPVLGDSMALFGLAPFVQYNSTQWRQRVVWRKRASVIALLAFVGLVTSVFLLSKFFPEATAKPILHHPLLVLPVWAVSLWGLVRQATRAGSMATKDSLKRTTAERLR